MISVSDIQKLADRGAVEKYIRVDYGGNIDALIKDINKSLNDLLRTDLKRANRLVGRLKSVFRYLPGKYIARLSAMEARYAHRSGSHHKALKKYNEALRINEKYRDFLTVAKTRRGLMDVYMYMGKYREALDTGKKALRYFKRNRLDTDAAQVMNNIGNIYHRMDNNRMALRYYNRAGETFRNIGGIGTAIIEFNRANIYANLNQIKQARRLYHVSANLYHKYGNEIAECQARYSLAYLYFLEDKYTESIGIFEKVLDRFTALGDHKAAAVTRLDLAEINIEINQYGVALMLTEEVAPTFKKLGMRYEQAKAVYFAAQARLRLSDFKRAGKDLKKAERLFAKEANDLWIGMVAISRSRMMLLNGEFDAALKTAERAQSCFKKSGDRRREIDARIVRLEALMKQGNTGDSLRKANMLYRTSRLLGYQQYCLFGIMGECHYIREDYKTALGWYKKAVNVLEKNLMGMYPDEIRFFFMADKFDSYRMVVDCLLKLGRISDSFLANLKGLALLNEKSDEPGQSTAQIPHQLSEQRDSLRAALKKLHQAPLGGHRAVPDFGCHFETEHKLWALERKIRCLLYPSANQPSGLESNVNIPSDLIRADEILINYMNHNSKVAAFCVTGNDVHYIELPITEDELNALLQKLNFLCEKAVFGYREDDVMVKATRHFLEKLYSVLLAPVEKYIPGRKIILLADGAFYQIPFAALIDNDGRHLLEKYDFHLITNPADLADRRTVEYRFNDARNAVFAVTSDLLPAISLEAEKIKDSFDNCGLYLDDRADKRHLIDELGISSGFVHIAAHASRSSENPLFSRIILGDGPFFPFDLFATGIKSRLVTLSGCHTAAPGLYYGNSFSLARAFHQAGGRFVLGSLWPVSDRYSMIFMTIFYRSLSESDDIYKAYRKALETIKNICDNPAFWGSFILLGI